MPRYDYLCQECGNIETYETPFEHRRLVRECDGCKGEMYYQFPVTAAMGFQPFEAYHDEALGCDITGRGERRQVMKALGVQEAGDRVGGARNFDEKAPHHITDKMAPTGEKFQPRNSGDADNWPIAVDMGNGKTEWVKSKELKSI